MRGPLLAALLLTGLSVSGAGCETSCPTALAEGVLVQDGERLVLEGSGGETQSVVWPSGYSVRDDDGTLVLVDWIGNVKAREGDRIRAGGGFGNDGLFHVCGDVTLSRGHEPPDATWDACQLAAGGADGPAQPPRWWSRATRAANAGEPLSRR